MRRHCRAPRVSSPISGPVSFRCDGKLVGVAGFEPATPSSRTRCATDRALKTHRDVRRRSSRFIHGVSSHGPLTPWPLPPGSRGDGGRSPARVLHRRPEEARCIPKRDIRLHRPGSARVPQNVWRARRHQGPRRARPPRTPSVSFDRVAVPLDNRPRASPSVSSAACESRGGRFTGGCLFLVCRRWLIAVMNVPPQTSPTPRED
jgi:hypothetical protein